MQKKGGNKQPLRPYIYLSEDTSKLMTYFTQRQEDNEKTDFEIYVRKDLDDSDQVAWLPWRRVTRLPPILTSCSAHNYLFSPSFERYIDFDFTDMQIIIRRTEDDEKTMTIPGSMFSLCHGERKSMEDIIEVSTRIMMSAENQVRILNRDNLDVILEFSEADQHLEIRSFVAVDNLTGHKTKKHIFLDKQYEGVTDILNKLVRQNAEFKQNVEHFRVKQPDPQKLSLFMYEQMYSVDVFQNQHFSSLMSFTILDWLVVQLLADKNSSIDFDAIDEKQLIVTCFNIFPRF